MPEVPSPVPFQPRRLAHSLGKLAKIMIVDDEPINVKVAQKYLALVGYEQFVTTTDPTEALALILAEMPDVILLDVDDAGAGRAGNPAAGPPGRTPGLYPHHHFDGLHG